VLGLRRQDAEANIRAANGPEGEPQDAASNPHVLDCTLRFLRAATRNLSSLTTLLQMFS